MEFTFEWSREKDKANQTKHGVAFNEARSAFADDLARLIRDPVHSVGEERFVLLGMSDTGQLLVVCHSERGDNRIRIISARKADRLERHKYEEFIHA